MKSAAIFFFLAMTGQLFAQQQGHKIFEAQSEDVKSIEAIIDALYETISGEEGEEREWDRFRSLWYGDANLIMVSSIGDGKAKKVKHSVETFIKMSKAHNKINGFYETKLKNQVTQIGNVAQVVSTYSIKKSPKSKENDMIGVNFFQLYYDGKRWWILNCTWQNENGGVTIPKKYK